MKYPKTLSCDEVFQKNLMSFSLTQMVQYDVGQFVMDLGRNAINATIINRPVKEDTVQFTRF